MAAVRLNGLRTNPAGVMTTRVGGFTLALVTTMMVACGGGGDEPAPANPESPIAVPAPAPAPPPTSVPDALNGKTLYAQNCSACHRAEPDERVRMAAGDGAVIVQAIGIVRIMNFLSPTIRPAQARDIALWLQDPR